MMRLWLDKNLDVTNRDLVKYGCDNIRLESVDDRARISVCKLGLNCIV